MKRKINLQSDEGKELILFSNVVVLDWVPEKKGHSLMYKVRCLNCNKEFSKAKHTFGLYRCQCYKTVNGAYNYQGYKSISSIYFKSCKAGAKIRNYEFSITKEFMWELWEKQKGMCALSGMPLKIERNYKKMKNMTASLDRIKNDKGYTEDNVQWIHKDINRMKNIFDNNYFIKICKLISKNN
jgi:hypothetical protein